DRGSISGWALEAVATAVENGIMNGYPDHTIQPQGNATRAEAVTVIVKALGL
ncbi:MAG TPA: S-layer homology domain-containing protein, partial [Pelotomaculum sp.]|nr:S-layer homology domain-containing protein [Pelotomaculum sp.]